MLIARILAATVVLAPFADALATPAFAQYNRGYEDDYDAPPPRRYRPPPPDADYGGGPYRGQRDNWRGPPPGPPGPPGPPRPPGPGYGGQRMGGSVCVTSRGSCPTGMMLPRNAPCACDLPGFGKKRGAIGY